MHLEPEDWREHRRYLMGVAYRLLGSVSEAEDAVHEAYLRWCQHGGAGIAEPRRWLTTVVSRICLDQLRSARARREYYVGIWLPEPLVGSEGEVDPGERVELRESVDTAILIVLESLTPAERTAFVLHDVFDVSFGEIAEVVGRSAPACRQLASRARARLRRGVPRFELDPAERERVVAAFLTAAAEGDLQGLVRALDPDVVFRSDGGGSVPAARGEVRGSGAVARLVLGLTEHYSGATARIIPVNGGPGILMEQDGAVLAVAAITVSNGTVAAVNVVLNPAKLRHLAASGATGL